MQAAILIRQIVDFQPPNQFVDVRNLREQGGNYDDRAKRLWNSLSQIEPRQRTRLQEVGDEPVDQGDRQVRRGHQGQNPEQHQVTRTDTHRFSPQHGVQQNNSRCENRNRSQIADDAVTNIPAQKFSPKRRAISDLSLELLASTRNEIVARIGGASPPGREPSRASSRTALMRSVTIRAISVSEWGECRARSSIACRYESRVANVSRE